MRGSSPLIHCITNYVTAGDTANMLLAAGASPIMADDPSESAEITALAQGLTLNLGTPSGSRVEAMLRSGAEANRRGIPVVFDPVGAGCSGFRRNSARGDTQAGQADCDTRESFGDILPCGVRVPGKRSRFLRNPHNRRRSRADSRKKARLRVRSHRRTRCDFRWKPHCNDTQRDSTAEKGYGGGLYDLCAVCGDVHSCGRLCRSRRWNSAYGYMRRACAGAFRASGELPGGAV